jgi:hypothetical protein
VIASLLVLSCVGFDFPPLTPPPPVSSQCFDRSWYHNYFAAVISPGENFDLVTSYTDNIQFGELKTCMCEILILAFVC